MKGKEARFWSNLGEGKVECHLCPHGCLLKEGARGICGVRENREGTLFTLVYGKAVSLAVDPIEKKPLFHYRPGSLTLSMATVGCNLTCKHCQNSSISRARPESFRGRDVSPDEIVALALGEGISTISYTYTEPTIFLEYAHDTARAAARAGLGNVFVTNGYVSEEALRAVAPFLDGANVDLKAFSDSFYRRLCGARLQPVLDSLALYKELGIWLEITTLIIPGENDSDEELMDLARFIRDLDSQIPWHVSRFHPTHRLRDRPITPLSTLLRAREIGQREGLHHIYVGNVPGGGGEDTCCSSCGEVLIHRQGFSLGEVRLSKGRCPSCSTPLAGVLDS